MLVRRIRKRGANIVVEAHGEVLFAPTGDIGVWQRRFSNKVAQFAAAEAPTNKRPRWGHYGAPLKSTFTASTSYQPGRMRIYTAIGSRSPHSYYVDQGTGVYAGKGPYLAKILPPWERQSPSLYEHTWKVPERDVDNEGRGFVRYEEVGKIAIRGQRGQGFMGKGLSRGFKFMRMRSYQVPGEGLVTPASKAFPTGLADFKGNTGMSLGFIASLREWRAWRDEAWNAGKVLGQGPVRERERRELAAARKDASRGGRRLEAAMRRRSKAEVLRETSKQARSKASIKRGQLAAVTAAANARKKNQIKALSDEKKRKQIGQKKQDAAAAKLAATNALRSGNAQMERTAQEFYRFIKAGHPGATLRSATLPDGVIVYRVTWTVNGELQKRQYAYGYGDG